MKLSFTCYAKPEPQGSARGFVMKGKWGRQDRVVITSANKKLKPYRQELTSTALAMLSAEDREKPLAGKHVPVRMDFVFYFEKPPSVPKKRVDVVVKPDLDKIVRSTIDALTGVLYLDDAQVVEFTARKSYGLPPRAEISITILDESSLSPKEQGLFAMKE